MRKKPDRKQFWDREYRAGTHLAISETESEDLVKFCRFLERGYKKEYLNPMTRVLDLGCGNGRNLIYLARTYGVSGTGIDTSDQAVKEAAARASEEKLPLTFKVGSISESFPVADKSQTLILDMMTSHVLTSAERVTFLQEILRVLRPGGWLFFKTFLLDEDMNAEELLRKHPGSEPGSYIHPEIGVEEHVFTETEIEELLSPHFMVHKTAPSHRHIKNGRAHKRRSISVYAQRG